ncbi:DUF2520 domain-containing protein [Wenzhouxiangella marina]|uniref:DUF2520 domain-containing protein n=1 Tax=Wenzhouxiangella marina TaxID=1579979 RepID=A0A0K0XVS6_9GAMM|nr:DUF2520 domain-containing protein [Wenzhouxiangella marina]AKS41809.1 hypothetical protein WM2015_1437 [Wenzhouxiangella marina]MBB6086429.1 putative short-subunit dehydrogenase-like oxidoreductase (DUF2520 family) [Wenzhouxiangella marina]
MPPRLHVLGAGRAARVLARWLADAGQCRIGQLVCRRRASAESAAAFIGQGQVAVRPGPMAADDWLLIGLPDDLLDQHEVQELRSRSEQPMLAFHLSGARSAELIRGVAREVASLHPARAFADPERALAQMPGTWFTAEGDDAALECLGACIRAAGGCWQTVEAEAKPAYHAATVVASNYLVTLTGLARRLAAEAGLAPESAAALIEVLQRGTLANLSERPAASALTGPIERGDAGQVERLQAVMEQACPDRVGLLRELGLATLELAIERRGPGSKDAKMLETFTSRSD